MQFLYQVFRTRIPFIEHRCHNGHLVAETFESECTLRSPNVVCRTCGEPVFVNAYIEWIEMTPAMRRDVWIGVAMATPFLGGALGVLLGAAALLALGAAAYSAWPYWLGLSLVVRAAGLQGCLYGLVPATGPGLAACPTQDLQRLFQGPAAGWRRGRPAN